MFSAGVGQTGTFIALDILTEQGQTLGYVDAVGCVTELRHQRISMVQTKVVLLQYFYNQYLQHNLLYSVIGSNSPTVLLNILSCN